MHKPDLGGRGTLVDLSGQVIVIAGAGGDIGNAMSVAFAAQGASLVLAGLPEHESDALIAALRATGASAHAFAGDVATADGAQALIDFALARCGRIDTLVVNAGAPECIDPAQVSTEEEWDAAMAANLKSAFGLSARVIPGMAKRGGGSILMMSGLASLREGRAIGLFGLSTAALAQLTGNLAAEWRPYGVRVNAISPGLLRSATAALRQREAVASTRSGSAPRTRAGDPDEVAGVALMLASRAGGFINGQNIVVDGGASVSGAR